MMQQRLFVAQIVVASEDQWFAPGTDGPPLRTEMGYSIQAQLFAASDEDDAYRIVSNWISNKGFSDSNHDGPGELTRIFALGIHQIEEIVRLEELPEAVHDLYGVCLPDVIPNEVDREGAPLVRGKEDLEIFRLHRLQGASRRTKRCT